MTRCPEFYAKLLKDGNFCGLSDGAISQIKGYLETVDKIASRGVPKEQVMERFPEGAARPLLSLKDDETRLKALNYVISRLKDGEKITAGDLKSSIKDWLGAGKCNVDKHDGNAGHVSKKFTNVNSPTEEKPDPSGKPLSEVIAKDEPHGSSLFHTAGEELAAKKTGIAGEMFPDSVVKENLIAPVWTPATCKTGPCPDGKTHAAPDKVRGICCDLTGQLVNQLKDCPYLERQRKAVAGGFVVAGTGKPSPHKEESETPAPNPRDVERENRVRLADELLACMPGSAHVLVSDLKRDHPSLKTTYDVIFQALVSMAEKGAQ